MLELLSDIRLLLPIACVAILLAVAFFTSRASSTEKVPQSYVADDADKKKAKLKKKQKGDTRKAPQTASSEAAHSGLLAKPEMQTSTKSKNVPDKKKLSQPKDSASRGAPANDTTKSKAIVTKEEAPTGSQAQWQVQESRKTKKSKSSAITTAAAAQEPLVKAVAAPAGYTVATPAAANSTTNASETSVAPPQAVSSTVVVLEKSKAVPSSGGGAEMTPAVVPAPLVAKSAASNEAVPTSSGKLGGSTKTIPGSLEAAAVAEDMQARSAILSKDADAAKLAAVTAAVSAERKIAEAKDDGLAFDELGGWEEAKSMRPTKPKKKARRE